MRRNSPKGIRTASVIKIIVIESLTEIKKKINDWDNENKHRKHARPIIIEETKQGKDNKKSRVMKQNKKIQRKSKKKIRKAALTKE